MTPEPRPDRSRLRRFAFQAGDNMKHPCVKNCPGRNPYCRIYCPKHRAYRAAKEAEQERKVKDGMISDYIARSIHHSRRRVKKGKRRQP